MSGSSLNPPHTPDGTPLLTRDVLTSLRACLAADARLDGYVAQPHPLLVTVRSGQLFTLIAPASVWDHGREVLRPFAERLADGQAMIVLLGRPSEPNLALALNRGLGALLPPSPTPDELFVAVHGAFDRLEAKARAESRGRWLNRYQYELGELIDIAKALTGEREIDKLLGLILDEESFHHRRRRRQSLHR